MTPWTPSCLLARDRAFVAGADIRDFGKVPEPDEQPKRAAGELIEGSAKPVVAAINGTAFGGGLELALTCHYRIAAPGAPVGLPEIKIGLLPGGGGTQRLPRLIGAERAMQAILSGDPFDTDEALDLGIVDAIAEDDLVETAIAFAKEKAGAGPHPLVRDRRDRVLADRANPDVFKAGEAYLVRRMRGQFNGQMAFDSVKAAVEIDDFDDGIRAERANFQRCHDHDQRAAMIHVFFAERQAARIPDVGRDTPKKNIASAATVGGGLMGGGIAMCFRRRRHSGQGSGSQPGSARQRLRRHRPQLRPHGAQRQDHRGGARPALGTDRGRARLRCRGRCRTWSSRRYSRNLDLKKQIFAKLDAAMKPGAVLASNTSGLDLDQMAGSTARPTDVVGMHFFSPANMMQLLEVVRGERTDNETLATAMALGKVIGKTPVMSTNAPGFIGNRMLGGYTRQAGEIILHGALPEQVDKVIYDFGFNMGPFAMNDLVGLDLGWRARKMAGVPDADKPLTAIIPDRLCDLGRFGQKTNAGFYRYPEGSRQGQPDPEVAQLIERTSAEFDIERRQIGDEEVLKRCPVPAHQHRRPVARRRHCVARQRY